MGKNMPDYIDIYPMPDYAEVKARPQKEWRGLIAIAFYCCGLGVGAYIFSLYYNFLWGMIVGYLVACVPGGLALFFDAGHGFRVWRAVTRFGTSWISRGVVFLNVFAIFGLLSIIGHFNLLAGFSTGSSLVATMDILAVLFGLGIMFYSGFVMSFSPSLPFWNNAIVPVIFLIYSFLGGLSLLLALSPFFVGHGMDIELLEKVELALILTTLFAVLVYMFNALSSGEASRMGASTWLKNPGFWVGVGVIGLVLPLIIGFYCVFKVNDPVKSAIGLAIAGFLELFGGFIFRFILLKAGYFAPLITRERR